MFKRYLKPTAPIIGAFLTIGAMILLPAKSVVGWGVSDLKSFYTHPRSESVAMCKADVKAIIQQMRKYVDDGKSGPEEIEARNQKLNVIEKRRTSLCEQNVVIAMRLNESSWKLVYSLGRFQTSDI